VVIEQFGICQQYINYTPPAAIYAHIIGTGLYIINAGGLDSDGI